MNMLFNALDSQFMALAIQQAKLGVYTTRPNPNVGCAIVKNNQLLACGHHIQAGEGHAEVNALSQLNLSQTQGATAYVTLEPCSHVGLTGSCAHALIEAKISKVVCAMQDPNPLVAGKGFALLKAAGIDVAVGLMQEQASILNLGFIKRMSQKKPWVSIKLAMSLDGRTAMKSGESQWITGSAARSDVQRLRAQSCAIITGIGSIEHDDSSLMVRVSQLNLDNEAYDLELISTKQPLRVVLDSENRISSNAKILNQPGRTLRVTAKSVEEDENLISLPDGEGKIDLSKLLTYLAEREGCNNVLVEAGATLAGSFVEQGLFDRLVVYMAPTLLGNSARALLNIEKTTMQQQQRLKLVDQRFLAQDIRLTYEQCER